MQEHEEAISEVGFVPHFEDITVDYDAGSTYDVEMHDGSHLRLRKLHEDYNPTDRIHAVRALMESQQKGEDPHRRLLHRHAEAQLYRSAEPWLTSHLAHCRSRGCVLRNLCWTT